MKLNGNVITGLFQYKNGIAYTIDDLILYKAILYIVISDYVDGLTPDESSSCMKYTDYLNQYSTDSDSIVTGKGFKSLLRSFMKGLEGNGRIESGITINSTDQLKSYKDTGVYHVKILPDVMNVDSDVDYILRVYKYDTNKYVQHLVSITKPIMYIISYCDDSVDINVIGNTDVLKELSVLITSIYNELNTLTRRLNNFMKSGSEYLPLKFDKLAIGGDPDITDMGILFSQMGIEIGANRILHTILQCTTNIGTTTETEQLPIQVYLTNDVSPIRTYLGDDEYIEFSIITDTDTNDKQIQYRIRSNKNYKLKYAYISNGRL